MAAAQENAVVNADANKDAGKADDKFDKAVASVLEKVTGLTGDALVKAMKELKMQRSESMDLTKSVGGKAFRKYVMKTRQAGIETEPGPEGDAVLQEFAEGLARDFRKAVADFKLDGVNAAHLDDVTRRMNATRNLSDGIECQTFHGRDGRCAFVRYAYRKARDGSKIYIVSYGLVEVEKARTYFLSTVQESNILFSDTYQKWVEAPEGSQGWTEDDRENLRNMLKLQLGSTMLAIQAGTKEIWDVDANV